MVTYVTKKHRKVYKACAFFVYKREKNINPPWIIDKNMRRWYAENMKIMEKCKKEVTYVTF